MPDQCTVSHTVDLAALSMEPRVCVEWQEHATIAKELAVILR